ncbi:hypothetical protein ACTWQL_12560 [Pseudalkalibacillus sp. R45]|uniref:hypothetical protein n=1 Tax=Pseudalkalibacillus sp. R45 TaxID=3457433 RepID=UPI003FCC9F25
MNQTGFVYIVKTQFTFLADDCLLSQILNEIASEGININGQAQFAENHCNLVKLVVGITQEQSSWDIRIVKSILRSLGVNFETDEVIQVLSIIPGVAGQYNAIYGALWCKVTVKAIYLGEDNTLYVDVSDVDKAIRILSKPPLPRC